MEHDQDFNQKKFFDNLGIIEGMCRRVLQDVAVEPDAEPGTLTQNAFLGLPDGRLVHISSLIPREAIEFDEPDHLKIEYDVYVFPSRESDEREHEIFINPSQLKMRIAHDENDDDSVNEVAALAAHSVSPDMKLDHEEAEETGAYKDWKDRQGSIRARYERKFEWREDIDDETKEAIGQFRMMASLIKTERLNQLWRETEGQDLVERIVYIAFSSDVLKIRINNNEIWKLSYREPVEDEEQYGLAPRVNFTKLKKIPNPDGSFRVVKVLYDVEENGFAFCTVNTQDVDAEGNPVLSEAQRDAVEKRKQGMKPEDILLAQLRSGHSQAESLDDHRMEKEELQVLAKDLTSWLDSLKA